MNRFALLLATTLLLASSLALAETGSSADLRYCLDLKSDSEIAKCAGEVAPGSKGKPFSQEQVEKILEKEKASAPVSTGESPGTLPSAGGKPADVPQEKPADEKTESNKK